MNNMRLLANTLSAVALLAGTAVALQLTSARYSGVLARSLETIPSKIGPWTAESDRPLAPTIVDSLKAASYLRRFYRKERGELELFVAYYAEQRAGEAIHTPKHCLPGAGWEFSEMKTVHVPFAGSQVSINDFVVQQGTERLRVLYWYHSRSRIVSNEYAAKLYMARDSLFQASTDGAIVKVTLREQAGAVQDGTEFVIKLLPYVQRCFRDAEN